MKPWPGIMKILEIEHKRNSKVLWRQTDIYNQIHKQGEAFLLRCCFNNDGTYPPNEYYFGLDSRGLISENDEIGDLTGEPTKNGYNRQARSSTDGFTIEFFNGSYRASSAIISFSASGGGWGPVKNIFMTNSVSTGVLISSAALSQELNLEDGDSVNLRMALSLGNA